MEQQTAEIQKYSQWHVTYGNRVFHVFLPPRPMLVQDLRFDGELRDYFVGYLKCVELDLIVPLESWRDGKPVWTTEQDAIEQMCKLIEEKLKTS